MFTGSLDKPIKRQLDQYRGTWTELLGHLMDSTTIIDNKIVAQLTKLQRDAVKDKFKVGCC